MCKHDIGGTLQSLIVTALISVTEFRWANERPHFSQQYRHIVDRQLILPIE